MCDGMAWMGLIVIPSNLTQPVSPRAVSTNFVFIPLLVIP